MGFFKRIYAENNILITTQPFGYVSNSDKIRGNASYDHLAILKNLKGELYCRKYVQKIF